MTGYVKPTNQILVKRTPVTVDDPLEVTGTVTECKPGRAVKRGADDYKVVIGTTGGEAIGFLGFESTFGPDRPADIDTAYASGDWASIVSGPGTILVAYGNAAITKGNRLAVGANGGLVAFDDATMEADEIVAVAEETITEAGPIIVRSLI